MLRRAVLLTKLWTMNLQFKRIFISFKFINWTSRGGTRYILCEAVPRHFIIINRLLIALYVCLRGTRKHNKRRKKSARMSLSRSSRRSNHICTYPNIDRVRRTRPSKMFRRNDDKLGEWGAEFYSQIALE